MPHGPVCHLFHGHVAMAMGPSNTSTSMPWTTMHPPWSCLLLCHIYPMDILQWAMGHSDTSTSIPCTTMYSPWSCLLLCLICPRGILQWTMGHVNCSSSGPLSHRPLGIPHCPVCWYVTCVTWICCNRQWDILTLQTLCHGTQ
jgi:hypothetical protein